MAGRVKPLKTMRFLFQFWKERIELFDGVKDLGFDRLNRLMEESARFRSEHYIVSSGPQRKDDLKELKSPKSSKKIYASGLYG